MTTSIQEITKTRIIEGCEAGSAWPSNDTYVSAAGAEMMGVYGIAGGPLRLRGMAGHREEAFTQTHTLKILVRRSRDNGLTWTNDTEPFWAFASDRDDLVFGYTIKSIIGFVLDPQRDVLIRFVHCAHLFGPHLFGAGSPQCRNSRMFYQVSHDGGHEWTAPRQVVCDGARDTAGNSYFWLDWAPAVRWGHNYGGFDQPSRLWLPDGTLILGFYRCYPDDPGRADSAALCVRWASEEDDLLAFEIGDYITVPPELSERGCAEPSFVALDDGRLMVMLRASGNEQAGTWARRYYALSDDDGRTWSDAREFTYDDGASIDVPVAMSRTMRCSKNGRVYWAGNILDEPSHTCGPRHQFHIGEVNLATMTLRRDSVTVVDKSPLGEGQRTYSNFTMYEDRVSGNPIIIMGENRVYEDGRENEAMSTACDVFRYEVEVV